MLTKNILEILLLPVLLVVGLSACATNDATNITVETKPTNLSIITPPRPRGIDPAPVQVVVVAKDNSGILEEQLKKDQTTTWLVIYPPSYQNLLANIADMKRYIQQQDALITYYENSVKSLEKSQEPEVGAKK